MKLDFAIIGAHKSGTTWLHKCLEVHPQICMPQNPQGYSKNKKVEPDFFNDTHMPWRSELDSEKNYPKGLAWYSTLFSHCTPGALMGESSPVYFHAPEVPERLFVHNPKMKLIVILREPASRLFSLYNYVRMNEVGQSRVPGTFMDFIKNEAVMNLNLYYTHIERYLQYFPKEQLHVAIYEDIEKDSVAFIEQVYAFLGVERVESPSFISERINTAESKLIEERNRKRRNQYGRYVAKLLSFVDVVFPPSFTQPSMTEAERAYVHDRCAEDIQKLKTYLNRDLAEWET